MAKELIDARLPTVDAVMAEFEGYSARRSDYASPEEYEWQLPVMYWIVTDMREAMLQYNHGTAELRKVADRLLRQWEKKLHNGEAIPEPVMRIGYTETPKDAGNERGLTTLESEKKGAEFLLKIRQRVAQSKVRTDQ